MPGELGNEEESANVGYYEHRYPQDSEWGLNMDSSNVKTGKKPKPSMIQRVLMRTRQIHEGTSDATSKSDSQ